MSPSRLPGRAASSPAHMHRSVTSSRRFFSGEIFPTAYVHALSPTQPSTMAPVSMEMMSPSLSTTLREGMPCTICSFTDAQMEPGNPP